MNLSNSNNSDFSNMPQPIVVRESEGMILKVPMSAQYDMDQLTEDGYDQVLEMIQRDGTVKGIKIG